MLLARTVAGIPIGCVALRPLAERSIGEVKRLFVRPNERGGGLGRALVAAILAAAEARRYRELRLDTLAGMTAAIALYREFGFRPIPPYGSTPYPGLRCFGLALPAVSAATAPRSGRE